MQHGLDVLERGLCKCEKCKAPCQTMPGFLVPGDLERIADYLGVPLTDEFVARHFTIASGGTVEFHTQSKAVPRSAMVLVPDQRPNGDCVFYKNGLCQIHQVAPFGCRMFEWCNITPADSHKAKAGLLSTFEPSYRDFLMRIRWQTSYASPLHERRTAMYRKLQEIDSEADERYPPGAHGP